MKKTTFAERMMANPDRYAVTTALADGGIRVHRTKTLGQARNFEVGELAKLGRELVNPKTGKPETIVGVDIKEI